MKIIFTDKETIRNERDRLLREAQHWLEKISRLNGRYGGKIYRLRKKIAELDKSLGE